LLVNKSEKGTMKPQIAYRLVCLFGLKNQYYISCRNVSCCVITYKAMFL